MCFLYHDDVFVFFFIIFILYFFFFFFFSSRRRHTRWPRDWSSDVCSSDLATHEWQPRRAGYGCKSRPRKQREHAGRAVQGLRAHAPIRLWPQTRTTLPFTAPDAGFANQAIVSARSEERRVGKECRAGASRN